MSHHLVGVHFDGLNDFIKHCCVFVFFLRKAGLNPSAEEETKKGDAGCDDLVRFHVVEVLVGLLSLSILCSDLNWLLYL